LLILLPWARPAQRTSHISRSDLKIRHACYWTRTCRHSASSSEFRQEKSWRSAGRNASSPLARRQRPTRLQHFQEAGVDAIPLPASKQGASRFISPAGRGFAYRHAVARPTGRRHRRCTRNCRGGIGDARGVIAALALGAEAVQMGTVFLACEESGATPPSSRNFATAQSRTYCLDKRIHGKTRTGNPQPRARGREPKRNRDLAISAATRSREKSRKRSGGCGPGKAPIFQPTAMYRVS
jgi:Nitronate monooxygenase